MMPHPRRVATRRRRRRLRRYAAVLVASGVAIPARRSFTDTDAYERWLAERITSASCHP